MDFRALLLEGTGVLGDVIRGADAETQVPTCPGWTMNQLLKHVGRGHLWSAQMIAGRRSEPLDLREVRDGKPPDDIDTAIDWLNAGAMSILDAVDHVRPETRVWTFIGPRPAVWWIRRRVHEVTVHRADAVLAVGGDLHIPPDLAADAVSEWIDLATQARSQPPPLPRGLTLHLHATDEGLGPTREWTITHDADGVQWSHDHHKGDVALHGKALDLLLALTRRRPTAVLDLEIFGDASVWDSWLNRTPF